MYLLCDLFFGLSKIVNSKIEIEIAPFDTGLLKYTGLIL